MHNLISFNQLVGTRDNDPHNDESAINSNYVSIVPCKFDLSSNKGQDYLKKNWKI